jgi:hypothetical protein
LRVLEQSVFFRKVQLLAANRLTEAQERGADGKLSVELDLACQRAIMEG